MENIHESRHVPQKDPKKEPLNEPIKELYHLPNKKPIKIHIEASLKRI